MHRFLSIVFVAWWLFGSVHAATRPNILWITAEDMSPTLGCYGDAYATTPHIDRLAEESVRYTHAFATAPVCSPSRSCLITGCYAPSLGTQQMRSAFPLPPDMNGFPALLRELGYYTSNNVKTDYNTGSSPRMIKASWNESSSTAHWRNRPKGTPFFSIFNLMTSHQSRAMTWNRDRFLKEVRSQLSAAEIHDPDLAPLPPYYPDTLVNRRVVARFYDCVTVMDKQVGDILRQLEEDGLADDTIVFFYSDHGSGVPRHKRVLLDSGMRVPLLVRFPKRLSEWAPVDPGETTDRLVSFVDFAPTVLRLAGATPPSTMQGTPFLGANTTPRSFVFGHRDRIDESFDVARSVRGPRYLYVRNFMPHLGHNQRSWWPDMGEIDHEFYRVAELGSADAAVNDFIAPTRPAEALYDCVEDPWNLHNLAGSERHATTLAKLREQLDRHVAATLDAGFLPESTAWREIGSSTMWESVRSASHGETYVVQPYRAAQYVGGGDAESRVEARLKLLTNSNPSCRYWAAIALHHQETLSVNARQQLHEALQDDDVAVQIEAAHALAKHGDVAAALDVLIKHLSHEDLTVVLHATRAVELLGQDAKAARPAMERVASRARKLQPTSTPATFVLSKEQDLAMFCSFSANNFLKRLQEGRWIALLRGKEQARWSGYDDGEVRFSRDGVTLESSGKNLWISHEADWNDFELTIEVKMPFGDYNSGVAFHCQVAENGRPRGYQCEIAESLTGGVFAIGSGGWVWPRGEEQVDQFHDQVKDAFRTGKWNHLRVRREGDRIQIWVNGVLATDIRDARHRTGRIALQHHGKGSEHAFRELYVRSLNGEVD